MTDEHTDSGATPDLFGALVGAIDRARDERTSPAKEARQRYEDGDEEYSDSVEHPEAGDPLTVVPAPAATAGSLAEHQFHGSPQADCAWCPERWQTKPWPAGSGRPHSDVSAAELAARITTPPKSETWLDIYRRQPQHPTAMFETTAGPLRLGLCGADTGKGNPCAQPAGDHPDHLTLHGFPDVQLVRPEPELAAAVHFVNVEFDGYGGSARVGFICKAALDAPCHMVCARECESCDHEPTRQVDYCNPGEYIDNGGEGPISQAAKQPVLTFPVDVSWNGDTYVWKVRDARPMVDREAALHHGDVLAALEQVYKDGAMGGEWPTLGADAVMELARSMPTREEVKLRLQTARGHRWSEEQTVDAVMALFDGTES